MARKKELYLKALERFREDFETFEIMDAVDCLDNVRPIISDEGIRPPEIRDKLMKLHKMAVDLMEFQSPDDKNRLKGILELADDIDSDIDECLENLRKMSGVISKLLELVSYDDYEYSD